ncbi:MAG TPA: 1-(5-phosphoribosyl)-5-[(5-phosphoribosylamino)methylideneamino]imidazole-4-carboxamide isomerase [Ignavibacteriales bacterium]|nr:1-(5-phosphoribosyl)-5-[(5-phosphoribosylamino)methylideneamino]imidazole-4-carboxamide isomerase [Ignavibacteriales bacterium]
MFIIPAIDVYQNEVVRLHKGDFTQVTVYAKSAAEQAKIFYSYGFKRLHVVDLLGSKNGEVNIKEIIKQIKNETGFEIEFGGGIRKAGTARELVNLGVDKIILGSISISDDDEFKRIIEVAYPDNIIIAADVTGEYIAIKGWTEKSGVNIYKHIEKCLKLDINTFLCTDISKDGALEGANLELYENIMRRFPEANVIASGGVKDIDEVKRIDEMNLYGAVIGKAIYEKKIKLEELAELVK